MDETFNISYEEIQELNEILRPEGLKILNNFAGRSLALSIKRTGRIDYILEALDEYEENLNG